MKSNSNGTPAYILDASKILINDSDASITARLRVNQESQYEELDLKMWFYQNGIMRTLIQEPSSTRFRISEENLPVVDEQLIPASNLTNLVLVNSTHLVVGNLNHEDGTEVFTYTVKFDHFLITMTANGVETLVVNPTDSLLFEASSISLGFKFNSKIIFGLPEREDTLMLVNTGTQPYEMFATD